MIASPDVELRDRLDDIYQAQAQAAFESTSDVPSLSECRDLLRLYVRLGNEDLRHAVLCLAPHDRRIRALSAPQDWRSHRPASVCRQ